MPVPRQQLVEPMGRMPGDAGEHVGEPGLRVDVVHLGRDDEAVHGGGALPPRSEPAKSHDFLPRAMPRRPRSAALFDRQTRPSSRKRVKAGQRFSM